jgi:hypothetical protein
MNMFRTLRADEIDCRIAQIKENALTHKKGLSLLLYKDARCDQNILDEVVGPFNWKREHTRDNRNCVVSIWDSEKGQWIGKEDTGTESNTEREKGLASDSFKRACFNWGIGRELYTAPFVWIDEKDCTIKEVRGKLVCYDRFTVKGIGYTDGVITGLEIKNQATGKVCYKWGEINEEAPEKPEQPDTEPPEINPVNQNTPGNVSMSDKLPKEARSPVETVAEAFGTNMNEFMERFEITDSQEALKKFNELREKMFKAGVVKNIGKMKTAKEVNDTFDAIYKNFNPGDAA